MSLSEAATEDRAEQPGRLLRAVGWLTGRRPRSAGADRLLLAVAAAGFLVATVLAARALPDDALTLHPVPLIVLALVAIPATNLANAAEYVVAARIGGHRVGLGEAVEVSVLSSAANLLPLPGAALIRIRALRRSGSSYKRALSVTALVGGAWLAISLVLAGGLLVLTGAEVSGPVVVGVLAVGLAGVAAAVVWVRALAPAGAAARLSGALVGAEVAAVAIGALRYLLVLAGIGIDVEVAQAVALTVAGVIASAMGFVPGGIGIREALAGAIATLVGLPAAVGVLAAGVDRLVGLPVLAVLAGGFALRGRRAPPPAVDEAHPATTR